MKQTLEIKKQSINFGGHTSSNYASIQQNKTTQGLNVEEIVYKEEIRKHKKYKNLIEHVT